MIFLFERLALWAAAVERRAYTIRQWATACANKRRGIAE